MKRSPYSPARVPERFRDLAGALLLALAYTLCATALLALVG